MTGNPCRQSDSFVWTGKAARVNQWLGSRAIRKKNKWIALMFEKEEYRNFKIDFGSRAAMQLKRVEGPLDLYIEIWLWKMRDTDGAIKAIQDALESHGAIENDRFIRDLTVKRHYHKKGEEDSIIVKLIKIPEEEIAIMEKEMKFGYEGAPS